MFDIISRYAHEHGIIAGVCSATPFNGLYNILQAHKTPFVNYDIDTRVNPALSMPGCKGIIVIGVSYNKRIAVSYGAGRGRFSLNACGADYHKIVRAHLEALAALILKPNGFKCQIYVDTGPLVEREIIYKAALAWRGKNLCAVSDVLGSMFNIGYILTDAPFVSGKEPPSRCGGCTKCLDACPAGGIYDYGLCISYLTQKKGNLTENEIRLLENNLYGCDICQTVCPYNIGKEIGEITDIDEIYPDINDILRLSKREFAKRYGNRAFFWRGLKTIKRNARIARFNLNNG